MQALKEGLPLRKVTLRQALRSPKNQRRLFLPQSVFSRQASQGGMPLRQEAIDGPRIVTQKVIRRITCIVVTIFTILGL